MGFAAIPVRNIAAVIKLAWAPTRCRYSPATLGFFFGSDPSDLDIESLDLGDSRVIEENLSLPPERKKGIILEGTDEAISGELARLLREEEKII